MSVGISWVTQPCNKVPILFVGVNCISRKTYLGAPVSLTLTELNDLLESLTGNTSQVYIITNDGQVFNGDRSTEQQLYDELRREYYYSYVPTPSSLWINKAPCASCTNEVIETFKDTSPKPIIYVGTFKYNETEYENLIGSMGCLAKLHSNGFTLKPWNWTTFSSFLQETNECPITIQTKVGESHYSSKKAHFEKLMQIFDALGKSRVDDRCE